MISNLQISKTKVIIDHLHIIPNLLLVKCSRRRFIWFATLLQNMGKIDLEKVCKKIKLEIFLLHLGIGGHGDRSAKLFGGLKPCYAGQ